MQHTHTYKHTRKLLTIASTATPLPTRRYSSRRTLPCIFQPLSRVYVYDLQTPPRTNLHKYRRARRLQNFKNISPLQMKLRRSSISHTSSTPRRYGPCVRPTQPDTRKTSRGSCGKTKSSPKFSLRVKTKRNDSRW